MQLCLIKNLPECRSLGTRLLATMHLNTLLGGDMCITAVSPFFKGRTLLTSTERMAKHGLGLLRISLCLLQKTVHCTDTALTHTLGKREE